MTIDFDRTVDRRGSDGLKWSAYLAWIDARRLGQPDAMRLFDSAGVRLSDGRLFQGDGFVRLNFGCPREMLQDALERISAAVRTIA